MTAIWYLAGLVVGIGAPVLFTWIALRSLLSDLWKLLFLSVLPGRKAPALTFFILWSLPVVSATLAIPGPARIATAFFTLAAIVPAINWFSLNLWAWWWDGDETRRAAWEIAVERATRLGDESPSLNTKLPWKDYLFDVEVARRRALYEPPPI